MTAMAPSGVRNSCASRASWRGSAAGGSPVVGPAWSAAPWPPARAAISASMRTASRSSAARVSPASRDCDGSDAGLEGLSTIAHAISGRASMADRRGVSTRDAGATGLFFVTFMPRPGVWLTGKPFKDGCSTCGGGGHHVRQAAVEIPDAVRDLAERNVEQARTAYTQFMQMAQQAQEMMTRSSGGDGRAAPSRSSRAPWAMPATTSMLSFNLASDLARARDSRITSRSSALRAKPDAGLPAAGSGPRPADERGGAEGAAQALTSVRPARW